jgi:tetratricopeptide (TPR) repeat protein
MLMFTGRCDEAVEAYRKGLELDPLHVGRNQNMGELLYYCRRYEESIVASLRAIDINPGFPQSHMFIGGAYIGMGKIPEGLAALDEEQDMSGGQRPEVENWIGAAYAMAGEETKAREVLDHLHEMSESRWVSPFTIATVHIALGETDTGFELLDKAIDEQDSRLPYLRIHPAWDGVRTDPRYLEVLERVGWAE